MEKCLHQSLTKKNKSIIITDIEITKEEILVITADGNRHLVSNNKEILKDIRELLNIQINDYCEEIRGINPLFSIVLPAFVGTTMGVQMSMGDESNLTILTTIASMAIAVSSIISKLTRQEQREELLKLSYYLKHYEILNNGDITPLNVLNYQLNELKKIVKEKQKVLV